MLLLDGWPAPSTVLYMVVCGGPDWMASSKRFACGGGLVALNMLLVFGGSLHACGGGLVALNMLLVVVALFMLVVVVGGSLHALVVGGSQHALGGWPCFWWLSTCSWWPADVMLDGWARFSTPCTGGGSSTCPVLVYMVFLINTWPAQPVVWMVWTKQNVLQMDGISFWRFLG
uniref:Uncharacterized protein n=1 Tax=Meloidogyne incognita TaxID=6306 RepID=A0A914NP35_MELIC